MCRTEGHDVPPDTVTPIFPRSPAGFSDPLLLAGKLDRPDAAADELLAALRSGGVLGALAGIGHRVVHGGPRLDRPCRISQDVLDELRRTVPYDPEHLPTEIALIESLARALPGLPQVACFDTAFHRDLPPAARLLPIPRRYAEAGLRRFGFHGLSCTFLLEELARRAGPAAAEGRVVLAHLGGGSSLTAVRAGRSVDTTMGFTPAAGVPMSTRSGDVDPGLVAYFLLAGKMTPAQLHAMLHRESGLLGLSETSGDVRELLAREAADGRAAEALAVYCHEVKKRVGALAAVLGGLDTLVFSGGVGEHAAPIRARVCEGLDFLGLALDEAANLRSAPVISPPGAAVTVRVIPTDEEVVVARATFALLGPDASAETRS